jgi:hypothetical protein
MNRSPSAIQTRASRGGLPERAVPVYATRNRLRWTEGDFAALTEMVEECQRQVHFTNVQSLAKRLSRTVDTVIGKLQELHGGPEILHTLVEDYRNGQFEKLKSRSSPPGAPPNTNKRCLSCRNWFWAQNTSLDWKCRSCRELHRGMTDNDIDFWVDNY